MHVTCLKLTHVPMSDGKQVWSGEPLLDHFQGNHFWLHIGPPESVAKAVPLNLRLCQQTSIHAYALNMLRACDPILGHACIWIMICACSAHTTCTDYDHSICMQSDHSTCMYNDRIHIQSELRRVLFGLPSRTDALHQQAYH